MAEKEPATDNLMFMLTENCDGIEGLLDTFFDFLGRRSDFFDPDINTDPNQHLEKCVKLVMRRCRRAGAAAIEAKREKFEARKREAEEKRKIAEARMAAQNSPKVIDATSGDADDIIDISRDQEVVEEVAEAKEETRDTSPLPGNGGVTKWYTWTQTLGGVDISAPVPDGTASRNLKVDITANKLTVYLKGTELFGGELHEAVKSDDCYWTLLDGKTLQINLEKQKQNQWWSCVIKGHPEIDVQRILPENSKLSDLDAETRQTVEKMMFDQRMNNMGFPMGGMASQLEALDKLRRAHPELDFSNAKIN
ncbi:nuclear movement family protein, putative [Babesia ovis]|uniref:Nuclear migration protein nudC n=1 Tax=Babesia ovis TaxID=5869 RepID=A0A9W5WU60_BABOV|nr:nuclear movement family protein, putative [Babesia ovis]